MSEHARANPFRLETRPKGDSTGRAERVAGGDVEMKSDDTIMTLISLIVIGKMVLIVLFVVLLLTAILI